MLPLGIHAVKLRAGRWMVPASLTITKTTIVMKFGYNKDLLAEVKAMDGAKWNPDNKEWSVANTARNWFQLRFLMGEDVYARYDKDLIPFDAKPRYNREKKREFMPYAHQIEMTRHEITRKQCEVAGEMGVGKSLSDIMATEWAIDNETGWMPDSWWYVAPPKVLRAFQRELDIWGARIRPIMYSYDKLVDVIRNWPGGKAPRKVTYDECSKCKNPTAQRSQAALHLANAVRNDWGDEGYVILMSGTPAPKSPVDWWNQIEIACPGFLKEGNIHKFKARLAVIEQRESITGGMYPHLITWRDSDKKCEKCGRPEDDLVHGEFCLEADKKHIFMPMKNEVAHLYERLKGLVIVKLKKDCLDLPEKRYETVTVDPDKSTLRAAELLKARCSTAIELLTCLRELSDGFQYVDKVVGKEPCVRCKQEGWVIEPVEIPDTCPNCKGDTNINLGGPCLNHQPKYENQKQTCPTCKGTKVRDKIERHTAEVKCPKDDAMTTLLEQHEEVGRIVIYGGFQGTIDRIVKLCQKQKWAVIRVDGRGFYVVGEAGNPITVDPLTMFQELMEEYPRVAWVAHPGSGGYAFTLTASPSAVYYSNDFNGDYRMQSEDRIHRIGMDTQRGATIYDIVHLPSDIKVIANLQQKRDLQSMSLGEVLQMMEGTTNVER